MLDMLDSEPESPFRLSRLCQVTELEDSLGIPASCEAHSPFKLSRLCELRESEPLSTLSTLYECTPNTAALNAVDSEFLSSVPAAIAEQYVARLSHVERLRQDIEKQAAELEASLGAIRHRDARQWGRGLCGVFLALTLASTMILHTKLASPRCSADIGECPPPPAHLDCKLNGCLAKLNAVEDDVSNAAHMIDRDTQGYTSALSGVDTWVTRSWEEGLFRGKVHNGGLARCVNETQVTYRILVAELNGTLTRRHDAEVSLRKQLWQLRRTHLGLGPRLPIDNLRN